MFTKYQNINSSSLFFRYGTAVVVSVAALLVTLPIWSLINSLAAPLFLAAIGFSAWKQGFGPGLFATALSAVAIDYFFSYPQFRFSLDSQEIARVIIFSIEGSFLSWIVSGRTSAVAELEYSRQQLSDLGGRQQAGLEDERKRIALEIHDELGQELSGLKMQMHLLSNGLRGISDAEATRDQLADIMSGVDGTIAAVRRIATDLRPPVLDDLGLIAALEWQLQEFERRTEIKCNLSSDWRDTEIRDDVGITIFRIFQESLTNVAKHAKAEAVAVELKTDDDRLIISVEDNGRGIKAEDLQRKPSSLGVFGMKERARQIAGQVIVSPVEPRGTRVLLSVPRAAAVKGNK